MLTARGRVRGSIIRGFSRVLLTAGGLLIANEAHVSFNVTYQRQSVARRRAVSIREWRRNGVARRLSRWPAGFQNITTCPVLVATGVRGSAGTGGRLAIGQNPEGGGARTAERGRARGRG